MTTASRTRTRKPAAAKRDLYAEITATIVELMEAGTDPWRKPWASGVMTGMPLKMSNGKAYRGVNVFMLGLSGAVKGYTSPWWGSYRQIEALGGQVRKGEKGTTVVYFSTFDSKTEVDRHGNPKQVPFLKYSTVFNAAQADGLPERFHPAVADEPRSEFAAIAQCQAVQDDYLSRTGIKLSHGGDRAAYSPGMDVIVLPDRDAFTGEAAEYYSTSFHELGHSTGHADRLNRPELTGFSHFGDNLYAKEELVAEMTSAIVCGVTGIGQYTHPNSAAYLRNWAGVLRGDSKLVLRAASKAQAAADLILGAANDADDETPETAS